MRYRPVSQVAAGHFEAEYGKRKLSLPGTSPYPELSLNEHIESMYKEAEDGLFLDAAYGFVLHSLSFPGMVGSVAERISPACDVSAGATHAYVTIALNDKSRMYGGAGSGGSEPLYSKFITWRFKFDGTDKGYGTSPSMDTMKKARVVCTKSSDALAEQYFASISYDALTKVMGGRTWIRCAVEGFGGGSTMCYIAPRSGRAGVGGVTCMGRRQVRQPVRVLRAGREVLSLSEGGYRFAECDLPQEERRNRQGFGSLQVLQRCRRLEWSVLLPE
ncbi:hypothetical protein [uncultured Adlercreutzia sp.]|uniref:hypothetical protein n=2 Tax=uncultured Adlercreutzia sp. TaxID=875803 RepID=UPI0026356CCD|nr:hypothetical protein [uncultured Adlercreutzia sp.]